MVLDSNVGQTLMTYYMINFYTLLECMAQDKQRQPFKLKITRKGKNRERKYYDRTKCIAFPKKVQCPKRDLCIWHIVSSPGRIQKGYGRPRTYWPNFMHKYKVFWGLTLTRNSLSGIRDPPV